MCRNQDRRHDAEFQALDEGASDWALHRARIADQYGRAHVDHELATKASDAQVAMAWREVARHRWALGAANTPPTRRRRTARHLIAAGRWLQRAFSARMALDTRPLDALPPRP